jgi:hypothetical protein
MEVYCLTVLEAGSQGQDVSRVGSWKGLSSCLANGHILAVSSQKGNINVLFLFL